MLYIHVNAQENSKNAKGGLIIFKERERIKTKAQRQEETLAKEIETKVFNGMEVDIEPDFTSGEDALVRFVADNLNLTVPLEAEAPAGTYKVEVHFVVFKDGSVKNVKAITAFGFGMEAEAERVIKKTNKLWKPATIRDKEVMCEKEVILTFQIQE
jgi:hypothetical protein